MLQERDSGGPALVRATRLHIVVPATCGNLGPGFDVLGLALSLHNEFVVTPAAQTRITSDTPEARMPADERNLFYRAFAHLHAVTGVAPPPLRVQMHLPVPSGRGLGSSATAVVGGLVAANAYLGRPFSTDDLLVHAVALEHGRHPDNVAPAMLGGLVVNVQTPDRVLSVPVPFPADLHAVLYMPDFEMDTVQGRALMPACYSRDDVVFNNSRVALFLAAIAQGRYEWLRIAMEDRMHQPYRAQLFPAMPAVIAAAGEAGAWGACLAGGGSSILALGTGRLEAIAAAMHAAGAAAGLTGRTRILEIAQQGVRLLPAEAP